MNYSDIIKNALASAKEINISYSCHTTSTNGEYVEVRIGETKISIDGSNMNHFVQSFNEAIELLKNTEYPQLNVTSRNVELHFYYHGFNSVQTDRLPVIIHNGTPAIVKTGKVTESYKMCGKKKAIELMDKYPDYELYKRVGFSFRGAQDRRTDRAGIISLCDWAACCDIEVIDNEIHVNGFSCSDMW